MPLNLKGRYPDESNESLSLLTKENFESLINQTKEFAKWMKKLLIK